MLFVACQKHRTLIALTATGVIPNVRGSIIPTLIWPDPMFMEAESLTGDGSSYPSFTLQSLTPVDHSVVSTQAFVCLLLVAVIILHVRNMPQAIHYSSEVFSEICGTHHRVHVYLCSVAKCLGDYVITAPTLVS